MKCDQALLYSCADLQVQKYVTEHLETLIERAAEQISGMLHLMRQFIVHCNCNSFS
jgi:hypothetical protein